MRKIIFIEPKDVNFITDRHAQLFYRMMYNYQWEIRMEKYPDVPKDCEKIFIWQGIARHRPDSMSTLINLRKDVQLIWYLGDVWHDDIKTHRKYVDLLKRADIILSPIKEYFKSQYPVTYENNRFKWFPHFVAPIERFQMRQNGTRKKLLVTGGRAPVYKLRNHVRKHMNKDLIEDLPYAGVHQDNHKIVNYKYAKCVNEYYCALATCSDYKFATGKYFEIPACNTLMVANSCQDVKDLGFIAGEHYIEVDESNAVEKIEYLIKKDIRHIGMIEKAHEFVMQNHTIENRLEQIKDIL